MVNRSIYPRCLDGKAVGYSASGHMLPCCWCDDYKDPGFNSLLTEELKIVNNNTVEDIFNSEPWKEFDKKLRSGKYLPKTCYKFCGKPDSKLPINRKEIRRQEIV
mgnify:FL=1